MSPHAPDRTDPFSWIELRAGLNNFFSFQFVGGVYALASGRDILYIGSTNALGLRVCGHEKIRAATDLGYKEIRKLVFPCSDYKDYEITLIRKYNPILNIDYRTDLPRERRRRGTRNMIDTGNCGAGLLAPIHE